MAETFTGLKLKGELGRFGKTEICDVLGVYPMPDEKVKFINTYHHLITRFPFRLIFIYCFIIMLKLCLNQINQSQILFVPRFYLDANGVIF